MSSNTVDEEATRAGAEQTSPQAHVQLQQKEGLVCEDTTTQHRGQQAWILDGQGSKAIKTASSPAPTVNVVTAGAGDDHHTAQSDLAHHPEGPVSYVTSSPDERIIYLRPPPPVYKAATTVPSSSRQPFPRTVAPAVDEQSSAALHLASSTNGASASSSVTAPPPGVLPAPTLLYMPWKSSLLRPKTAKVKIPASPLGDTSAGITVHAPIAAERILHDLPPPPPYRAIDSAVGRLRPQKGSAGVGVEVVSNFDGPPPSAIGACLSEEVPTSPIGDVPEDLDENVADVMFAIGRVFGTKRADAGDNPRKITAATTITTAGGDNSLAVGCDARGVRSRQTPRKDAKAITADLDHVESPITPSSGLVPATDEHDCDRFGRVFGALRALGVPVNGDSTDEYEDGGGDGKHNEGEASGEEEEEKEEVGEAEGEEEEEEEKKRKNIFGSLEVQRSTHAFEPDDSGREKRAKLEICSVLCCTAPLASPTFVVNEPVRGARAAGPVQAGRSPAAAEALMIEADAQGSARHTASADEGREPADAADHSVASVNVVDKMVAKIALAIASSKTAHTGSASSGTLAENVANPAAEEEYTAGGKARAAGAPSQEIASAFAGRRPGFEEGVVCRAAGEDSPRGAAMREPSSAGPVTSIWVTHGTPVVSGLAGAAADMGGEERPLTQGSASRRSAQKAASRFGVLLQSFFFGSCSPEDARPNVSALTDGQPPSLAAHDEEQLAEQSTTLARYGEDRDGVSGSARASNADGFLSTPGYSDGAAAAPPSPTDPSPTMTYEGFTVEEVDQAAATVEEVAVQHFFEDDICTLYELPSPVGSVHDVPTPPYPEAEAEQCIASIITQGTPETQDELQVGSKSGGVFLALMEDVERAPSSLVPTTPASAVVDESLLGDVAAPADAEVEAISSSIGAAAAAAAYHLASHKAHEVPAVTHGEGETEQPVAVALDRQEGEEAFEVPTIPETVFGTDATATDAAAAAPTLSDCGVATAAEVPVVNKAGHVEAAAPTVEDVGGSSVEESTVAPAEDAMCYASADVEAEQSVLVIVSEEASDNKGESESGGQLPSPERMLSSSRACLWPSAVTVQDSTVKLTVGADPATAPGQTSAAECSVVAAVPNLPLYDRSQTSQKEMSLRNPDETTVLATEDDPMKELGEATADGSAVVSSAKMKSEKPASAGTEHGPEEPDSSPTDTVLHNSVVRTRAITIARAWQSAADISPVTSVSGEGYEFLAVKAIGEAEAVGDASRQYTVDETASGGAPLNGQPGAERGGQQVPTSVESTSIEAGIACDGGWMYSADVVTIGDIAECMQVPDTAGQDSVTLGNARASSPSEDETFGVQVLTGEMPNEPGAKGGLTPEPFAHDASAAVPSEKMEGDVAHLSAALGAGNSSALCAADADFGVSDVESDTEDADSWWIPEDIDAAGLTQGGELLQEVELDEVDTLALSSAPYFAEATPLGGPGRSDANEVAVVPENATPERTPLSSVSDEDLCMPPLTMDYSSPVYGLDGSTTSSGEVSDGELVQAMDFDFFKEEPEDEVPVFTDAEEWGHPPLPPEGRVVSSTGGEAESEGLLQAHAASAGDGAPGWSVIAPPSAATSVAEVTSGVAIEVSAVAAGIEDAAAVAEQSTVPAVPVEHVPGAVFEEVAAATAGVVTESETEPVEAASAATNKAPVGTTRSGAMDDIEQAYAANNGPLPVEPLVFVLASALTDVPVVPVDEGSSVSASASDDSSPATAGDCSPTSSAGKSGTSNVPTGSEGAQVRWEDAAGLASSASEQSSAMASEVSEARGREQAVEMVDDTPREAAVFPAEATAAAAVAAYDYTGGEEEDVSQPQNVDCFAQACGVGSILSPIDESIEDIDVPAAVEATECEAAHDHVAADGEERFVVVHENSRASEETTASASWQGTDLTQTSDRVLLVTELDEATCEAAPGGATASGGDILESDTVIEIVPLPVDSVATLLARLKSDFVAGLHEELSGPVLRLIFPSAADESLRTAPADTPEVDTGSVYDEGVAVDKPLMLEDAADDVPERVSKIACQLPTIDEADGVIEVVEPGPVSDAPPEDDHYESTCNFIGAADAAQGRAPLLSTGKENIEDGGVLIEQPGPVAVTDAPHVAPMENQAVSSADSAGEMPDISSVLQDCGIDEALPYDGMASGASSRSAGLAARSWAPSQTIGANVSLSHDLIDAASMDHGAFPSITGGPRDVQDHKSFRVTKVGGTETNEQERSPPSAETTLPAVTDAYDATERAVPAETVASAAAPVVRRECSVKSPGPAPSLIGVDEGRPALLPEECYTKTHDLDVFVLPAAGVADEKPEELQATEYDGQSKDEASVVPAGAVSSTELTTPRGKALPSTAGESVGERLSRVPVEDDMPAAVTPDDTPTDFVRETQANPTVILTADERSKQEGGESCLTGLIEAPVMNDVIGKGAVALAGQSDGAGDWMVLVGSTESAWVPASVDTLISGLREDSSDTALNKPSLSSFGASLPAAPVEASEAGDAPLGGIVVQMATREPSEKANEAEPPASPEATSEPAREPRTVGTMEDVEMVTGSYPDAEAPLEGQNSGGVVVEQSADVSAEGTPMDAVPEAQNEPSALLAGISLIVSSHLPSGEIDATTSEANGDGSDSTVQAALAAGAARGEGTLLGMEIDGFETVAQELSPEATPLAGAGGGSVDFDGVSPAEVMLADMNEAVLVVTRAENVDPEMSGAAAAADPVAASEPETEPDLESQSNLNEGAFDHSEHLRSPTNEIV